MTDKRLIEKDLEESDSGIFHDTIQAFAWKDCANQQKASRRTLLHEVALFVG
jgi:hypothetical protein